MLSNPSLHVSCRLLGGSGRPQLVAAPPRKLSALWMVLTAKLKNPISPQNFSIVEAKMQRSHRHRCSRIWRRLRTWSTAVPTTQEGKVA